MSEDTAPRSTRRPRKSSASDVAFRNSDLEAYINTVTKIPNLSREQEEVLTTGWYEHKDLRARDQLVKAHLRHVVALGLRYQRFGISLSELVAEGNVGIVHALTKFEPARGFRFVTYAGHWIRAYMLDYIIRSWSLVGAGSGALRSRAFFGLRRERARLVALHGEGAQTDQLLADKFGVSVDKVRAMLERLSTRDLSIDWDSSSDWSTPHLGPLASDLNQETLLADLEFHQLEGAAMQQALKSLEPRERFIIERRFLADDDTPVSLAEVGRHLGLSAERTRQLEIRAKRKLKLRIMLAWPDRDAKKFRSPRPERSNDSFERESRSA